MNTRNKKITSHRYDVGNGCKEDVNSWLLLLHLHGLMFNICSIFLDESKLVRTEIRGQNFHIYPLPRKSSVIGEKIAALLWTEKQRGVMVLSCDLVDSWAVEGKLPERGLRTLLLQCQLQVKEKLCFLDFFLWNLVLLFCSSFSLMKPFHFVWNSRWALERRHEGQAANKPPVKPHFLILYNH